MITNKSKCEVCLETLHKYKCPVCLLKYCSVSCYKIHKEKKSCTQKRTASETNQRNSTKTHYLAVASDENGTDDQVSLEQLKMLGQSDQVLNLLQNPHLRTLMQDLNKADNPAEGTEQVMHEPIFLEFVNACLNVVEPETVDVNT